MNSSTHTRIAQRLRKLFRLAGSNERDAFRRAMEGVESETTHVAQQSIAELGQQGPRWWSAIWNFSEALYSYATCAESCAGSERDHTLRYIAGRATNVALGAIDAATAGWYDNSLLACRALGEQANLVALLVHSGEALAIYKAGDKKARMSTLGPNAVRKQLAHRGLPTLVSKARADLLSERVVHPAFDEIVLSHNMQALVVGPVWQEAGFLLCLNEIAIALGGYVYLQHDPGITESEAAALVQAAELLGEGPAHMTTGTKHLPIT
jgi:hypothetical protein